MRNELSYNTVRMSHFSGVFRAPCHRDYSFRRIPGTIEFLLGSKSGRAKLPKDALPGGPATFEKIIVILIDAFGWTFFERFEEQIPFLKALEKRAVVSCLTSQFPSTTAAHVTTIHTGAPIERHGIVEWYFYEPSIDRVIAPLLFSFAEDHHRETLLTAGYSNVALLPESQTLYQDLRQNGIPSWVYQSSRYALSSFSRRVLSGAHVVPFQDYITGLQDMASLVARTPGPGYFFFYIDAVDSIGHTYGPHSVQFKETIERVLKGIELEVIRALDGSPSTMVAITADHGQIPVSKSNVTYLNEIEPRIHKWIRRTGTGLPVRFGGSPRDLILYLKDEYRDVALSRLRELLAGKAEVYLSESLVAHGIFQTDQITPRFTERIGDIIILPYNGEQVFWFEPGLFNCHFLGHHGGMTPDEMEVPFIAFPL